MNRSLVEAARSGNVEYLLRLIRDNPLLLETVGLGGAETPLHIASLCGHLDFVKKVLELKSQFACDLNQDGYTPLHLASVNGHLEIVVELLKLGNDLCIIQGKELRIALHFAVVKGRTHVIKELISSCPDSVEMKTAGGETALHLAVKNNQFGSLRVMLEHLIELKKGAVLNEQDNQGNTILHLAVLHKQYQVVDSLLSDAAVTKGVMEVNSKNKSGLTPLDVLRQFQSEAGDLEIETMLLKAGAHRSSGMSSLVEPEPEPEPEPPQFSSRANNYKYFFRYKKGRDKASDVRSALLTIAALILAATYQAALSPPSGLWQESGLKITPQLKAGMKSDKTSIAGTAILAGRNQVLFVLFVLGNSIGFYTAIYTINFLTGDFPMQMELQLSFGGIVLTYVSAMHSIIPDFKTSLAFGVCSTVAPIALPLVIAKLKKIYYNKYSPRNNTP